ncbi:MAG: hypothetical protein SOV82_02385 [[Ruminococcus] gnavus]|nr:hypothetical protein [Mediterraneibacter gnavus]
MKWGKKTSVKGKVARWQGCKMARNSELFLFVIAGISIDAP